MHCGNRLAPAVRAAGLLAVALAVGMAAAPDAVAGPPHLREGVTFGVAAGYSPGRASMFPDSGATRSDSDWEMGVTPQFRLGYPLIKNRLLLLVAVQQWAYEQGVLADDKGRINAQNWTLSLTWCPGDPHGATGGIQVTAGIGVANARLTLLQPLENDPQGDTFEEIFKEDEQGTAYQIGVGYEFRLTRALAAGLSVSYIHQAIDGWIFEDTASVPLNLTLNWYW